MSVNINVVPKEFIKTYNVDNVEITVTNLKLGESVEVYALLKSSNDIIDAQSIVIAGEEYNSWGQSDQYLLNLVLSKLGLTSKTTL